MTPRIERMIFGAKCLGFGDGFRLSARVFRYCLSGDHKARHPQAACRMESNVLVPGCRGAANGGHVLSVLSMRCLAEVSAVIGKGIAIAMVAFFPSIAAKNEPMEVVSLFAGDVPSSLSFVRKPFVMRENALKIVRGYDRLHLGAIPPVKVYRRQSTVAFELVLPTTTFATSANLPRSFAYGGPRPARKTGNYIVPSRPAIVET